MTIAVISTLVISFAALNYAAVYRSQLQHGGSPETKLREQRLWHRYRDQQSSLHLRKSSGQKLIDYNDIMYLMNITIGTPPQTLTVIPDTGSSNLWVIAVQCTEPQCQGYDIPKKTFNHSASTTFVYNGDPFVTFYGTEECAGYIGFDVLAIDGLSYPKQGFAFIDRLPELFGYDGIDGVLGLAWPAFAYQGVTPPMQNFLNQLDKPIFTIYLTRNLNQPKGEYGGQITFGGYDLENCDKEISWLTLTSQSYWQFLMIGFTVDKFSSDNWHQVVSNTGIAHIGMPETYLMNVISAIPKSTYNESLRYYTAPCSAQKDGPSLVFKFSGFDLTVPAIEYIIDLNLGYDTCALALRSTGHPSFSPNWIFGGPFIRTYCNIHELAKGMIGFAKAKNPH